MIVSRGENYRAFYIHQFVHLKTESVGQLNVRKNQFRFRIGIQVFYRIAHRFDLASIFIVGATRNNKRSRWLAALVSSSKIITFIFQAILRWGPERYSARRGNNGDVSLRKESVLLCNVF